LRSASFGALQAQDKFHADTNAVKLLCCAAEEDDSRGVTPGRRNKIVDDREYASFTSHFASDLFICTRTAVLSQGIIDIIFMLVDDIFSSETCTRCRREIGYVE